MPARLARTTVVGQPCLLSPSPSGRDRWRCWTEPLRGGLRWLQQGRIRCLHGQIWWLRCWICYLSVVRGGGPFLPVFFLTPPSPIPLSPFSLLLLLWQVVDVGWVPAGRPRSVAIWFVASVRVAGTPASHVVVVSGRGDARSCHLKVRRLRPKGRSTWRFVGGDMVAGLVRMHS
jgi:hypothetical protein